MPLPGILNTSIGKPVRQVPDSSWAKGARWMGHGRIYAISKVYPDGSVLFEAKDANHAGAHEWHTVRDVGQALAEGWWPIEECWQVGVRWLSPFGVPWEIRDVSIVSGAAYLVAVDAPEGKLIPALWLNYPSDAIERGWRLESEESAPESVMREMRGL